MRQIHILDEEDSPTAVNSVGPPAGQVQPVNLIGHLGVPQPLWLSAHPGAGLGAPTTHPPPPLSAPPRGGDGGGARCGPAWPAACLPAPWQGLWPLTEGSWPPAGQQGAEDLTLAGPSELSVRGGAGPRHLLPPGVCAPLRTSP